MQKEEMQHHGSVKPQAYLESSESSQIWLLCGVQRQTMVDKTRAEKMSKLHFEGC